MNNRRLLFNIVLCMIIISILPTLAWANSAEPPSLVILINNPPDDLKIQLLSNKNQPEASVKRVAWEGYYFFYSMDLKEYDEYIFKVTTEEDSFEFTIDAPLKRYRNIITLNLSKREITHGKYPFRTALLVLIRLVLTLLIEGIIFWFFGFRQKRSWMIFFAINFVTQSALYFWLNSGDMIIPSYLVFSIIRLIIGEFLVFATEIMAFTIFVKEFKNKHIWLYTFVANLISLIIGGYVLVVLPV